MKNILLSVGAGFVFEIVSLVCGLISQKLILVNFGSAYNGITQSITQFISYIELMKAGIGGVTMAALYKPLANKDWKEMNEVLNSTQKFMKRLAGIFLAFVLSMAVIYPTLIVRDFGFWFSASLILIISISTFAQYYLGFTYQMLIEADRKGYLVIYMQIITTILNTVVSIILINAGCNIQIVKLGSSIVHVIPPLFFYIYVHRNYPIDSTVEATTDKIPQRWDAATHEVAAFVCNNTDIAVITILAGVAEVSVYSIYYYVVSNIKKIVTKFSGGFSSAFGTMYAKKDFESMRRNLGVFELIIYSLVSTLYAPTMVMIVPFVTLYTKGINDVNYYRPVFAAVLILASIFNCFRIPYRVVVLGIGHYKETREGAVAEAIINIVVSVLFTLRYGIIGVAIGSLCAMATRSYQFASYLSKEVIDRDISYYFKHVFICVSILGAVYLISLLYMHDVNSWSMWFIYGIITTFISLILTTATDFIFYKEDTIYAIRRMMKIFKKR